ncbi:hypothetical protein HHE02_05710 [Helicobacter heilmannii]|uniref:hypothetical protein n=1 Tax=Helicobacter heilmannii TaxID=35817 RepID=UPI0006A03A59|nr:hypothetical protein [Helicobacter heilmannii]CRF45667.1 hypothetical protein HHE014_06380 [Helicobacter heilmannii]CRF47283.1 hypothetical protein HHE02_05710 [Helicobacter heilmannii]CRF51650.1 hypothetical protein HHE06_15380 [Helicobacter heilmannii]
MTVLSLDIDGVDYFAWEAITCIQPAIVIIEFTPFFVRICVRVCPTVLILSATRRITAGCILVRAIQALIALGQ